MASRRGALQLVPRLAGGCGIIEYGVVFSGKEGANNINHTLKCRQRMLASEGAASAGMKLDGVHSSPTDEPQVDWC